MRRLAMAAVLALAGGGGAGGGVPVPAPSMQDLEPAVSAAVVPDTTSVLVTWTPSADDGASTVTSFDVQKLDTVTPGALSAVKSASPIRPTAGPRTLTAYLNSPAASNGSSDGALP